MQLLTMGAVHLVENAINAALQQDPISLTKLRSLAGQQLLVEVENLHFLLLIQITEDGLILGCPTDLADCQLGTRDTHISGHSQAYRKLLEGNGFFDGDLRIQGNVQTLMTLHRVSQHLDIDWQGLLADKIGDLPASIVATLLSQQWHWGRQHLSQWQTRLTHYLQNESDLLPSRAQFNQWVDDLEQLENRLDRLEVRLKRHKVP
jgi:ubiquinone biosynthesis protein UbiJ